MFCFCGGTLHREPGECGARLGVGDRGCGHHRRFDCACTQLFRASLARVKFYPGRCVQINYQHRSSATQSLKLTPIGSAPPRCRPTAPPVWPFHEMPGCAARLSSVACRLIGAICPAGRLWMFMVTVSPAAAWRIYSLKRAFNSRTLASILCFFYQSVITWHTRFLAPGFCAAKSIGLTGRIKRRAELRKTPFGEGCEAISA